MNDALGFDKLFLVEALGCRRHSGIFAGLLSLLPIIDFRYAAFFVLWPIVVTLFEMSGHHGCFLLKTGTVTAR